MLLAWKPLGMPHGVNKLFPGCRPLGYRSTIGKGALGRARYGVGSQQNGKASAAGIWGF